MVRNGLAHSFAHDLAIGCDKPEFPNIPNIPDSLAEAFGCLNRHVAVAACPRPTIVITQEQPNAAAAWALAGVNAGYAAVLIWSAAGLSLRALLLRLARPLPILNLSIAVYAITLTALLIWR